VSRIVRRVELRESWARSINVLTCVSRRWIERIVKNPFASAERRPQPGPFDDFLRLS